MAAGHLLDIHFAVGFLLVYGQEKTAKRSDGVRGWAAGYGSDTDLYASGPGAFWGFNPYRFWDAAVDSAGEGTCPCLDTGGVGGQCSVVSADAKCGRWISGI